MGVMKSLFIPQNQLFKFWNEILNPAVADIYFPRKLAEGFSWQRMEPDFSGEIVLNDIRIPQPLKGFFFLAREEIASFPSLAHHSSKANKSKKILIGAKACDLKALPILDFVFKEGNFKDSFYMDNRDNTFIISGDCTTFVETCFCTLLENKPYPEDGFDLNVAQISDGFLVDVGSSSAEALVEERKEYFTVPRKEQLEQREANRQKLQSGLIASLGEKGYSFKKALQEIVKDNFNSSAWKEIALSCVECGGCNFVCPTCHCFLLSEEKRKDISSRFRNWDACLYPAFARVAGGANPRKRRAERLRNRFDKKFIFFPDVLGTYACTGCGRCIEACLGKIDIREVFRQLASA